MLRSKLLTAINGAGGGGGVTAARYWRVNCYDSDNATYIGMAGLDFMSGGSSLLGGGTALASADAGGSYGPERAIGSTNANTRWVFSIGAYVPPQWIGYDFVIAVEPNSIEIMAPSGSRSSYTPIDFTVDSSSDMVSWETVLSVTGEPAWSSGETRTFSLL